MSDKKMNDFPTAADGAFVYAEDANGNQIKISKADLASVVAGLLYSGNLYKMPCLGIIENPDEIMSYGEGYIYNNKISGYPEGHIYSFPEAIKGSVVQFYFSYNGSYRLQRIYDWSTQEWKAWKSF